MAGFGRLRPVPSQCPQPGSAHSPFRGFLGLSESLLTTPRTSAEHRATEETTQALETLSSPKLPSLEASTSASSATAAFTTTPPISSICPFQEPPRTPSLPLSSNPDMDPDMDADMEPKDQDSALPENNTNNSSRSKKPKGLELAPTIMITGSDPSPLIITLALFSQTPFLTLCPLVSSIHFWSTLSPVAPLSPARLQDLQKTTYALVESEKQGINRETLNMNIFKVCD
eukprot:bmy_22364T0